MSASSPDSARMASARRSTHPANNPGAGPVNGLCTVGKSPSQRSGPAGIGVGDWTAAMGWKGGDTDSTWWARARAGMR